MEVLRENKSNKYKDLSIIFQNPIKNNNNIYISRLETPIKVELPELEIYSVGNKILNGIKEYQIWYSIDLNNDKHNELLELLYFLEEKAMEESFNNSKQWFNGKQLSKKTLENLFVRTYDSDEESTIILKLIITDKSLLPLFENRHFSSIEFEGIRFFQRNFGYSVTVKDVNIVESDDNVSNVSSNKGDNINLIEYLNNDKNIDTNSQDVITDEVVDNLAEDNNNDDIYNDLEENVNNKKDNQKNELPIKKNVKNTVNNDTSSISTKVSELSKIELKSVLSNKRNNVQRYFTNAERANRAAENLRLKAIRAHNDLKKYEDLYSQLSESSQDE
jgi:hypothetical protein